MKRLFGLLALAFIMVVTVGPTVRAQDLPDGVKVGDAAPDFRLKNVDGSMVSLSQSLDGQKGAIIVFTCNHCPYAIKYEDRLIALHDEFAKQGYPVIAINPNDPKVQPEDSFEKMQQRAKDKSFPFPYIFDETQQTAKLYGARRTPHVYVVTRKATGFVVDYIGAIDDNPDDAAGVEQHFVAEAINAILKGEAPGHTFTKAIGCTIKWKKQS